MTSILNFNPLATYHLYDSHQEQEELPNLLDQPHVHASWLQLPGTREIVLTIINGGI